jgi:hypothetical protein
MKKLVSVKWSGNTILVSLVIMLVVHLLIVLKIIPYTFVWGGQIKDTSSLYLLEGFSILTTLLFILIICLKIGHIQMNKFKKTTQIGAWILALYLLLNTIGNLASGVTFEKLMFTPITVILTFLAFRVATDKGKNTTIGS